MKNGEKSHFLDLPKNRRNVIMCFYLSLVILLIIDFFIHKHGHFSWEVAPVFFAAYGFIGCVSFIFVAKILRLIVKRKEDYYD